MRGQQAARALDGYSGLRDGLFKLANARSDWAGIPMPLDGQRLVIEPSFPKAAELMTIGQPPTDPNADDGWRERNRWYSARKGAVVILMEKESRISWGLLPAVHGARHALQTLGCADAWGIEQEARAVQLLGTLTTHRQFKHYMLTGMFLETSKRSGVTYLFRRLRPTVAIAAHRGIPDKGGSARILCALCMHPIAYYADSWAGAMVPTDDVIAHLMLMRGDERLFWARCNQHPAYRPEAGL